MSEYSDTVRNWLASVASLVNPMLPGEAAKALANLRQHLATFPAYAFTSDTARAVAEAKRFGPVPSWDVIAPVLREATRARRQANFGLLPAPVQPDRQAPTEEEKARVSEKISDLKAELLSHDLDVEAREHKLKLSSVFLKKEQLAAARRAAGIAV